MQRLCTDGTSRRTDLPAVAAVANVPAARAAPPCQFVHLHKPCHQALLPRSHRPSGTHTGVTPKTGVTRSKKPVDDRMSSCMLKFLQAQLSSPVVPHEAVSMGVRHGARGYLGDLFAITVLQACRAPPQGALAAFGLDLDCLLPTLQAPRHHVGTIRRARWHAGIRLGCHVQTPSA